MGYEIKKTRPAVIIQNDISNEFSPITIVAASSSTFATPSHPHEVIIQPGPSPSAWDLCPFDRGELDDRYRQGALAGQPVRCVLSAPEMALRDIEPAWCLRADDCWRRGTPALSRRSPHTTVDGRLLWRFETVNGVKARGGYQRKVHRHGRDGSYSVAASTCAIINSYAHWRGIVLRCDGAA